MKKANFKNVLSAKAIYPVRLICDRDVYSEYSDKVCINKGDELGIQSINFSAATMQMINKTNGQYCEIMYDKESGEFCDSFFIKPKQ